MTGITLQIHDFPYWLSQKIKRVARRHGMTLRDYLICILHKEMGKEYTKEQWDVIKQILEPAAKVREMRLAGHRNRRRVI